MSQYVSIHSTSAYQLKGSTRPVSQFARFQLIKSSFNSNQHLVKGNYMQPTQPSSINDSSIKYP